jgi:hypothetical protein
MLRTHGTFFFYTRLKSGRKTTVQHQWYYKGSLVHQVLEARKLSQADVARKPW